MESEYMKKARSDTSTARLLRQLKEHDIKTYTHSLNVAYLVDSLLRFFTFDGNPDKVEILKGCLLHDIGKMSISAEILNKSDRLNEEELALIMSHPKLGLDYIQNESYIVRTICLLHHEKLNGTGYPQGLSEGFIPDYCKLVTIADIAVALCEERVYRKPCKTYNELRNEFFTHFSFLELYQPYLEKVLKLIQSNSTYLIF